MNKKRREKIINPEGIYPLVEGARANGTSVGLLARVNSLVLPEGSTVGESLPAEATAVWSLARVYAQVDLLRASAPKGFAALATGEGAPAELLVVRVTMAHQRPAVREFLVALVASNHFVAMGDHVPVGRANYVGYLFI